MAQNVHSFTVKDINKQDVPMSNFANKVVLIVNVASYCGYTRQYTGLQALYSELKDRGFVVVGFPSNQFGEQEPGTNQEIQDFCERTYNVNFPLMDKIDVNGPNSSPLYIYLKEESKGGDIKWNFAKFLVDRKGHLIKRYDSGAKPESIKTDILSLL